MNKPQFFVIGAQKCATTWLYECLKEHPQLYLPQHKRERNYLGGTVYRQKGEKWYYSLFDNAAPDQKICDVSVEYLIDPDCPPILKKEIKQPKFILCLRNPVDRALSALFWYQRRGNIPRQSPDEYFDNILNGLPNNLIDGYNRDILTRGFYHEQIQRYLHVFSPNDLLIVLYDTIEKNPQFITSGVFQFMDVDKNFIPKRLTIRPKINLYNSSTMFLDNIFNRLGVPAKAVDMLNRRLVKTKKPHPPLLSQEVRKKLTAVYWPHNEKLLSTLQKINVLSHIAYENCIRNWK
ncbi:sulfotransferase domain-containing protein [candidate division KSB1 bacterium]|nr:sulfotransferase domain-containing protein [candidate division KSB1 bacterium]